jgi:hypothetical protein
VHLRLQDIRFEHRLTCSQSVIELTRCEFLRRSGPKVPRISAEQSLVTLIDTKLDGYAGGPGFMDQPGGQGATAVSLNESTLILIGSVVRGGSGESSYTYDFTENCDPPPGGPGGLGILANAGDISVLDSNVEGGRGGNGASCLRGPTGMAGPMGCAFDIDAATRVTLDGAEIVNGPDCPPVAGEIRLTPQRLLAHLLGLAQLTAAELQFTDPNGDGKTDIADVVWLQQN